jgi:hypothetical protein
MCYLHSQPRTLECYTDGIFKSVAAKPATSGATATSASPAASKPSGDLKVAGYQSSEVFAQIKAGLESQTAEQRKAIVNSVSHLETRVSPVSD